VPRAERRHFVVRAYTAQLTGMKQGDLRVYPAEIGGAFGGKTVIYVEPVAVMLSRKSGHPVKIVMSREDVFRATGPTSGASMTVRMGVKRDGTIVAADGLQEPGARRRLRLLVQRRRRIERHHARQ
jgi:CO/xanthine dehydrogenase Mo-binding subunit